MKKIAFLLLTFMMAQSVMAQQFSLPIMPEKMWPSDYANYENVAPVSAERVNFPFSSQLYTACVTTERR